MLTDDEKQEITSLAFNEASAVVLRNWIRGLNKEIKDYEASFNLRWNADMRAIKMWQEAHPGKELIWPDHADLVVWLMEQLENKDK